MSKRSQKGISFLEIMASVVIMSILLFGFTFVFTEGRNSINEMGKRRIALCLVQQMTEEIKSQNFEEAIDTFGLEEGESDTSRQDYDDVDDYNGWSASPPQRKDGTPMDSINPPDYKNFKREVEVANVSDDNFTDVQDDGSTDSKRITVTVSSTLDIKRFNDVTIHTVVTNWER
ncbi:MAG: type II secretion system protein [Thermodesulfobacteriota bacterium]|nr:type II secretion system protein [Thermodesulfobacteriota bacterium]